jgi:CelD/BcsL family acetyltransferase involved in cellulose biosynthesis
MSCTLCLDSPEVPTKKSHPKVVYQLDPLGDPRWEELLKRHSDASVFHSTAWLKALSQTYGYEPVVYTTSPPTEDLENGLVFCRIKSWLTGRRLVSLPFSDHCEPLVDEGDDLETFAAALEKEIRRERWRYIELRPLKSLEFAAALRQTTVTYHFHQLDLRPDIDTIFRNFHKDSTQRKIRRANREGLKYEEGTTEALLDSFYRLLKMTRRRHKLPPQPREWFSNLVNCFGETLKIRIALKDGRPVAGMLTLRYKDTLVYKYGCSDSEYNNLGGVHLLLWRSIQEAKNSGLQFFDLGRTDADQTGLVTFKNRWGAARSRLAYSRYAASGDSAHVFDLYTSKWKSSAAKRVLACLQPSVVSIVGRILYKHVG